MNEVNRTLFIPLYGKACVSRKNIILNDQTAERIWEKEKFPIKGKSKSKWLTYNMAMRARVFDDWTDDMLKQNPNAAVLHIGCGLDSRCQRVKQPYKNWIDADFPDVIAFRKRYYSETPNYHMLSLDASDRKQLEKLPCGDVAIVILEGISMYLSAEQLKSMLLTLAEKYSALHILLDVYTEFGAKASKLKNPVNDVGVTKLYGVADIHSVLDGTGIGLKAEHSFTPDRLVDQLSAFDRAVFGLLFCDKIYRGIYRLYELERTAEID